MNRLIGSCLALFLGFGLAISNSLAQTSGSAKLEVTLLDYTSSSGTRHWTVAWVTPPGGTFIKSVRRQGPSWTSTHGDSHCKVWNSSRGGSASGSQVLDKR